MDALSLERYQGLPAAAVYESNGRRGDMSPRIRPLFDAARLIGPAFTVKCWPGDLGAMRWAVDHAAPGDVLVIDAGDTGEMAFWGGGATIAAQRRGLAGIVTNGAVRDAAQIREAGFPVFAAGIALRAGTRHHPGWTGIAVSVGDVAVRPGDLVVGDLDGVVVVAAEQVREVLERAAERQREDGAREARLRAGEPYDIGGEHAS